MNLRHHLKMIEDNIKRRQKIVVARTSYMLHR
jgi:hypothetical protein